MKVGLALLLTGLLAAAPPNSHPAATADRDLAFLSALEEHGYGDIAVEYLHLLRQRSDMPAALRDTWDLEMSRSLRIAANSAFNAQDCETLLAESQQHLAKFLQEKPQHPEAVAATASWGNFAMDRALKHLRAARMAADPAQKAKLLGDARKALDEAHARFKEGADKLQAQLATASPFAKRGAKKDDRAVASREDYEENLLSARFQLALVDYYIAQTCGDAEEETRKLTLQSAAQAFDTIFQTNRLSGVGLLAHMWHGKAVEELGQTELALDIYDEVLANAPEPGQVQKNAGVDSVFAQVELFRLQILAKQSPREYLQEATQWLQAYKRAKDTEGYQGILLEVAKTRLAEANRASSSEKGKLIGAAMSLLAEMVRVNSPYQQEAILLRRQYAHLQSAEPASFEEAVVLGDAAAASGQWPEAATQYARAVQLLGNATGKAAQRAQAARDALANAIFMQAREQFSKGQWAECIATTGKVVRDHKDAPAAAVASSLAVNAALNLYVAAAEKDKPAALERLVKIARFTEVNWPGKPEADDARMALGRCSLVQGKTDEALAVFEKVDARSERYPSALQLAGHTYWRRYLTEKAKPQAAQNAGQMTSDRALAVQRLTDSLAAQRKHGDAEGPPSRGSAEAQLLLAEIAVEGNQPNEAAARLQPLIDATRFVRPENLDAAMLRVCLAAARVYDAQGDADKAAGAATILADVGPDTPPVNAVLIELVKVLNGRRKQAEAAVTEATSWSDTTQLAAAQAKLNSINQVLEKLLAKLSPRKQFSAGAMVYLADTSAAIGLGDAARDQYQQIAARAEQDAEFAKLADKALLRVRAQLVGLLSKDGKYEEALKQVKQLVAAAPRALEPQMQQGRILQAWSQQDPSHYAEAIVQWTKIHDLLLPQQKKPPEYYEATYFLASCLCAQAAASGDKTAAAAQAKRAEQLLKSTLVLSPKLSGPDMVAKYKTLLQKAAALQRRSPEGEKNPLKTARK